MKYIICGGTGFIGSKLKEYWLAAGHEVLIVGRKKPEVNTPHPNVTYHTWDDLAADPSPAENSYALVNLAGSPLSQRWTSKGKQSIMRSRLETVALTANLLSALQHKPSVIIQASAVAIYGTSLTETFDETSSAHVMDFPSEVVQAWEAAADTSFHCPRLVKLRIGVVLGNESGALPQMRLPYLLGVGGKIGSGKQWLSWIHLHDIVRLINFCIETPAINGPVNATAPNPITNDQFGRTLGQVYRRPHWFPLPSFALKAALGELSEILLKGQRVLPSKALAHGFSFDFAALEPALRDLKNK